MTRGRLFLVITPVACALLLWSGRPGGASLGAAKLEPTTSEFGERAPGRQIYARPGLLSDEQETLLQREAEAIERSGLAVVVFMRIYEATYAETQRDAAQLLERWRVESEPGSRDGVVVFANLRVSDPAYGWVVLAADSGAVRERALTPAKLSNIRRWMIADVVRGDMPEAVTVGLRHLAYEAQFGPTPRQERGAIQSSLASTLRGPLLIMATLCCLVLLGVGVRIWRGRFPHFDEPPRTPSASTVTLYPASFGALRDGRVTPRLMAATLVDFAIRGALTIEPTPPRLVLVRLLAPVPNAAPHEKVMWNALVASTLDQVHVHAYSLSHLMIPFARVLRIELENQGWFDPTVNAKRRTLVFAGTIGIVLAIGFALLAIVSRERWGLVSAVALASVGALLLVAAQRYPATTALGRDVLAASQTAPAEELRSSPPSNETLARLETLVAGGRPA